MRPILTRAAVLVLPLVLAMSLACSGLLADPSKAPTAGSVPSPPSDLPVATVEPAGPADEGIDLAHRLAGGMLSAPGAHPSFAARLAERALDPWVSTVLTSVNHTQAPVAVEVRFLAGRAAWIEAIVVGAGPIQGDEAPQNLVISVAETAGEGWRPVASAKLPATPGPHKIRLPTPVLAAQLQVTVLPVRPGGRVSLVDLRVLEKEGPSILDDHALPVQHPLAGGTLVRTEGKLGPGALGFLPLGPEARSTWAVNSENLPLDLVYALRGDGATRVREVVIYPGGAGDRPGTVSIQVSTVSPTWGFREVGRATGVDSDPLHLPMGDVEARFVKVRFHDAPVRQLNLKGIEILESPGGSLLKGPVAQTAREGQLPPASPLGVDGLPWSAGVNLPLDTWGIGAHAPGSVETWTLDVPGTSPQVALNLELRGTPSIGVGLTLRDSSGKVVAQAATPRPNDPAQTWVVAPGRYVVEAARAADSVAFLWDESGSMRPYSTEVRGAIRTWVETKRPDERVLLMPFDDKPIERLKGFVADPAPIQAALSVEGTFRGGTQMYTALSAALAETQAEGGNRAVILVTDGVSSPVDKELVWRTLEGSGIPIFAIGLGTGMDTFEGQVSTSPARQLCHLASANGGLCLVAPEPADIGTAYAAIRDRLRAPGQYALRATVAEGRGKLTVLAEGERMAASSRDVLLILDVSCSMAKSAAGVDRMRVAKDALTAIVNDLPSDTRVGLRLYGHRVREGQPKACEDSELVQALGPLDRAAMIARIEATKPLGTTPIAYTLSQVANDLQGAPGQPLVVLMTDGDEECAGDPAQAVTALRSSGLDVRVEVVGLALSEAAAGRMGAVAEAGGGTYHAGKDPQALARAIRESLAVPWALTDGAGQTVAEGRTGGEPMEIPLGTYRLRMQTPEGPLVVPNVQVVRDGTTRVRVARIGGRTVVEIDQDGPAPP